MELRKLLRGLECRAEYVVAPTSVPYAYPTAGGYYPGGVYPGGVYGGAHHGYGGGYAPAMHVSY